MSVLIVHQDLFDPWEEKKILFNLWEEKRSCLPGSLILNAIRNLQESDQYFTDSTEFIISGWSIPAHVYSRVIEPFVYRMKPKYFFTPYLYHSEQLPCGIVTGPLIGGGLIALITASIMGLCAPWYLVGVSCIPSLAYLYSGIKSFGQGVCHMFSKDPDHLLKAKMAFQEGLGNFLIALLIPLACVLAFPIELVRFVTRCVMTVVEVVKNSLLESVAADISKADFSLAF